MNNTHNAHGALAALALTFVFRQVSGALLYGVTRPRCVRACDANNIDIPAYRAHFLYLSPDQTRVYDVLISQRLAAAGHNVIP